MWSEHDKEKTHLVSLPPSEQAKQKNVDKFWQGNKIQGIALGIAKIAEGTSNIASLQLGDPTLIKKRNFLYALKGHGTDDQNKEAENYFKDGGIRNLKEFKYTRPEKIKVQIEKYIDTRTSVAPRCHLVLVGIIEE